MNFYYIDMGFALFMTSMMLFLVVMMFLTPEPLLPKFIILGVMSPVFFLLGHMIKWIYEDNKK